MVWFNFVRRHDGTAGCFLLIKNRIIVSNVSKYRLYHQERRLWQTGRDMFEYSKDHSGIILAICKNMRPRNVKLPITAWHICSFKIYLSFSHKTYTFFKFHNIEDTITLFLWTKKQNHAYRMIVYHINLWHYIVYVYSHDVPIWSFQ